MSCKSKYFNTPDHICASCRQGYDATNTTPGVEPETATLFVKGHDGNHPYRMWVCDGHYDVLCDNADIGEGTFPAVIDRSRTTWLQRATLLTRKITAYTNFDELCHNYPTLRTDPVACRNEEELQDVLDLRAMYAQRTGHSAYPENERLDRAQFKTTV